LTKPWDILVVDDDQNMRGTLAEILAESGYDVRVVSSGEEAVELCGRAQFRLVLMDVRMPGINGLEAFRQIRQRSARSHIALMSAYAHPDLEQAALREGVLAILRKPLDIETVMKLIAELTSTAVLYIGVLAPGERMVPDALTQHGYRATFVRSAAEALTLAGQIHFDALVLDVDALQDEQQLHELQKRVPADAFIVIPGRAPIDSHLHDEALAAAAQTLVRPLKADALIGLLETVRQRRLEARSSNGAS
jgi:DNA-binding NtrC family response regulator